eukprot:TRINITY_DN2807_c0_g3_i1.p1 TRINITY_DN2807_c0_g3~~TRINITY_DN2807_c0_g3_i1.p1  ORF type:complete len:114 (+),score=15.63 TRINITY_DN2807_c0_g3_i1:313-654(+)
MDSGRLPKVVTIDRSFVKILVISLTVATSMIPGTILTVTARIIFSQWWVAFLAVSLGSTIGASLAFLIGRFSLRSWVLEKTKDSPVFHAIDSAITKKRNLGRVVVESLSSDSF